MKNGSFGVLPGLPVPGEVLGGKYTIVRKLGEGAMGVVYEATHARLRQRLAVKVLRPDLQGQEELLARFEREARITAQLRSVHTARVVDVDTTDAGMPYLVMEYLEGRDLAAELYEAGGLAVPEAVDIAIQIASAMQEAHENGVVHRDIKPANLFVCRAGSRRVMKVLDFGVSDDGDREGRITHGDGVGTPCYAAPEQLLDAAMADARSDVYSLGSVLYEMLSGRPPFDGSATLVVARVLSQERPPLGRLRQGLPGDLERIVMKAIECDPDARFPTMRAFAAALAPYGMPRSTTDAIGEAQGARTRLGEILVADGLLAPAGLARALAEQRRTGRLLGGVLLDLGLVSRADLLAALAKQQGIAEVDAPMAYARSSRASVTGARRTRHALAAAVVGLVTGVAGVVFAVRASDVDRGPSAALVASRAAAFAAVGVDDSDSTVLATLPDLHASPPPAAAALPARPSRLRTTPSLPASPAAPAPQAAPFDPQEL
jgi:tRNA A-37 threonylcarbamoyl transferase component Bud32